MRKIKKRVKKIFNSTLYKYTSLNREYISKYFIVNGEGIEIGAMDSPLPLNKEVKVNYLDRVTKEEQIKIFPDLDINLLVNIDIIGDGETLNGIEDNSQNFVIANHMLEHCQNPILTIQNFLRVLKSDGIIFLAIPDKRFTFDKPRKLTSWDHMLKDFKEGPAWSENDHYFNFVKHTYHGEGKTNKEIEQVIKNLRQQNFSIHFHVWDHSSLIEFFFKLKSELFFPLNIEFSMAGIQNSKESIFILRKTRG